MAQATEGASAGKRGRRTVLLASLGGALEYYDFVLYGVFAGPIGQTFFPKSDPLVQQILAFAVFAAGYFARPLGGAVLGPLGDRYGRRGVFLGSMLVVSLCTFAMAFLPGYAAWGIAASLSMVGLRIVQGLCLGGELPGATTYAAETWPWRPALACGVVFALVNSGVFAATLLKFGLDTGLGAEAVNDWGWRIGFAIGGGLGLIAYFLRKSLEESQAFESVRDHVAASPLIDVLRAHPGSILVGVCVCAATTAFNGLLFAHTPAYLTGVLRYTAAEAGQAQNICLAVGSVGLITVAFFADRLARRRILRLGALVIALGAYPFYHAVAAHRIDLNLAFALAGVAGALVNGVFAAILADLYPTRLRFTGLALSMNLGFTVFGALAPLVATWLIKELDVAAAPGLYLSAMALFTVLASFLVKRREGWLARDRAAG